MTAVLRVILKCDRHGCEEEYQGTGQIGWVREQAEDDGWYCNRDMRDFRRRVDFCPSDWPAWVTPRASS